MASVTASDVRDITTAFVENYMQDKWSNVVREYQHHVTADELFTKRMKRGDPSEKITFNLKTDEADNTQADSFFKKDSLNRVDLFRKGEVKWSFQKTHFLVDAREPVLNSGNKNRIFDYYLGLKQDMMDGLFKANEGFTWTNPAYPNDGSSGDPVPWGIPHWLTTYTTTSDFGLNGGAPTGYASAGTDSRGNVSNTLVPNWKNATFAWTSMSNSSFCKKASEALNKCDFKAPKPSKEEIETSTSNFGMYSDYSPFEDYEDALYGSNESVGEDMGRFRGGKPSGQIGYHYFRGIPWRWVAALTNDGDAQVSSPTVYFINWSTFVCEHYGDWFMKTGTPISLDEQHNTIVQWMDTGWQMYCTNLRANCAAVQV